MMPLAAIDWHASFFALFAALACAFGLAVVASNNIVRMAFYLTLSLGATAGLFFLAGAQFVGAMQFMIYVGGTLVLLIFGVMLTAQSRFISMKTGAGEWVAAGVLGAALLLLLVRVGMSVDSWRTPRADRASLTTADIENTSAIGLGLVGVRVDKLDRPPTRLPNSLSGYLFPFVIVSMHLLVVLVGAGYMARTKRRGAITAASRSAAAPLSESLAAPSTGRKHSFLVRGGIISGIVLNAVLALASFTFSEWTRRLGDEFGSPFAQQVYGLAQATPAWLPPVLGLLFALNVLLLAITWQWQRWGAIGLLIVPFIVFAIVASTRVGVQPATVLLVVMLLPAVALLGLLLQGGRRSAWAGME
jgi:NADH-quinone oxidoreductase subunit J